MPIEQSEIMADAMKSAGKPVEFIRFPGEDHYLNLADTRIRFLKETEAFWRRTSGSESAHPPPSLRGRWREAPEGDVPLRSADASPLPRKDGGG